MRVVVRLAASATASSSLTDQCRLSRTWQEKTASKSFSLPYRFVNNNRPVNVLLDRECSRRLEQSALQRASVQAGDTRKQRHSLSTLVSADQRDEETDKEQLVTTGSDDIALRKRGDPILYMLHKQFKNLTDDIVPLIFTL